MGCAATLEVDPGLQERVLLLIWSNICATNWECWEEVSASPRAASRHSDANLLLGPHIQHCPSVLACVPQDGTIHIPFQSMMPVSLCAQRAAPPSHPTGQHTVGAQTPCLATKHHGGSHRRNNTQTANIFEYLNARMLLPVQTSACLMPHYFMEHIPSSVCWLM